MKVTFVTGASAAGKTTVGAELARRPGVAVVDVDGNGLPRAGHLDWLRWKAAELLYEATQIALGDPASGHMVVCGIVWPHDVIDSNAWAPAMKAKVAVRWLMLDLPDHMIRARLGERLADRPRRYRAGVARYNVSLAARLRHQVGQQRRGRVLRVAGMAPPEIADVVEADL